MQELGDAEKRLGVSGLGVVTRVDDVGSLEYEAMMAVV
jgi:hypothetical protein